MQVDHISYIFGSFTRRRQSKESRDHAKRRSINHTQIAPPNIQHDRSHSAPHTPQEVLNAVQCLPDETRGDGVCPMCEEVFGEPRVLPCLHTVCTKCLHEAVLHQEEDVDEVICPICHSKIAVPAKGIAGFPLNYLLQHKLMLKSINSSGTRLLCDVCPGETEASHRCNQCAMSLCQGCVEVHCRQKGLSSHTVLTLEEARKRGITRVRRQIMCSLHPQKEISIFCSTCAEVICRDCALTTHKNHTCEPATKAARSYIGLLRDALANAKSMQSEAASTSVKLNEAETKITQRCAQVREEIDQFIDSYIATLHEHREKLCLQVEETRATRLRDIQKQRDTLTRKRRDAHEAMQFGEELLQGGSDVELLTFLQPVLHRMANTCNQSSDFDGVYAESLQFLRDEVATTTTGTGCSFPLHGILTTQIACAKNTILHSDGLHSLRVGKRAELVVEVRDKDDFRLERGGGNLEAEIRHRDAGNSRTLLVHVEDRRDGTYAISFTPDVAGKLLLFISIRESQIKDSPFALMVKTLRPHHGTFHCCSFCSSGGSKEASCGCGGRMPGGYRGCGHGHEGHPGKRHWSCCGNVVEHSECVRASSSHYQFTL